MGSSWKKKSVELEVAVGNPFTCQTADRQAAPTSHLTGRPLFAKEKPSKTTTLITTSQGWPKTSVTIRPWLLDFIPGTKRKKTPKKGRVQNGACGSRENSGTTFSLRNFLQRNGSIFSFRNNITVKQSLVSNMKLRSLKEPTLLQQQEPHSVGFQRIEKLEKMC